MKNNSAARSIYVIGALFFVFGFVTWINSVLIPFLKQICELTDFQAYFVTFAFYISYFVMAIPSSWVLRRSGFVRGMSYGLLAMAVGSILFIPAALDRSYALFLLGLFLQGTGLALLQTASNPYVTILGPIESAAQRISIMGVCNKIAGMTGIFLLSRFLFSDIEGISAKIAGLTGADKIAELHVLAEKIIVPYVCITVVLILLALVIRFAVPQVVRRPQQTGEQAAPDPHKQPHHQTKQQPPAVDAKALSAECHFRIHPSEEGPDRVAPGVALSFLLFHGSPRLSALCFPPIISHFPAFAMGTHGPWARDFLPFPGLPRPPGCQKASIYDKIIKTVRNLYFFEMR